MFNEQSIIDLFEKHWSKVKPQDVKAILSEGGGISAFECILMYLYILSVRPRGVIEFSPNHGYSSMAIAMAQRQMRNMYSFATFEINKTAIEKTNRRMIQHELVDYCQCIEGNANTEVPKYIRRKTSLIDMCFIDSDHRAEFATNYIKNIFPLLQPGCLVGVHDIAANKRSTDGIAPFKSSLHGGTHSGGEENPIRQYINKNNCEYSVLHAITGGIHEAANQPVNTILYKRIQEITKIDFSKTKGPCPKTLFLRIK